MDKRHQRNQDSARSEDAGTLTLHVRVKRDARVVVDAASKGMTAPEALWHSIAGCQAWLEYCAHGLSVTYSAGSEGIARDRELGMVGDFATSRVLDYSEERALFEAVAKEYEERPRDNDPGHVEPQLRFVSEMWRRATGEVLEQPREALSAKSLIVAIERLNREETRVQRRDSGERGWSLGR